MDNIEIEKRALIIANDYGGIFSPHEVFYIESILYSANRCLDSFNRYEQHKSQDVSPDVLISIIQEAVGHAAALSRYFWPSTQSKKEEVNQKKLKMLRGQKLRKLFKLNDTSKLNNRDLRNAWEHFDERLDKYLLEQNGGFFFPNSKIGNHTLADESLGHIFKLLDPDEECLVLMNEKYFFLPIRQEVESIFKIANKAN